MYSCRATRRIISALVTVGGNSGLFQLECTIFSLTHAHAQWVYKVPYNIARSIIDCEQKMILHLLLTFGLLSVCACSTNKSCPTWFFHSKDGECICGSSINNLIICNNETEEVCIQTPFCLTSFSDRSNEAVVGNCLFAQSHGAAPKGLYGIYTKVDKNISQQDQQLCGYLNREGTLCGQCKHDHFISPYSYDLKCLKCNRGLFINVIMYLTVAFLPLTLFLIAVVTFHISVASPRLQIVVFLCQLYSQSENIRVVIQNTRGTAIELVIKIIAIFYGIWNLDFFRALIPPICLPLNTMQVIALDYLVAVYPLLILVCVYHLVRARDRGCRLVVRLWRPLLWCSARLRQQWNARHSVIDAFATFMLLSYMKFLNTSTDLLITTTIHNIHGSSVGYFMYYDATVKFTGPEHLPYVILAATVLVLGSMFPILLLLYPMNWFQILLNKCGLNSPGLRMFMECFQGYYRDRSDGGWECRYFSALYPVMMIGNYVTFIFEHNDIFLQSKMIFVSGVVALIIIFHPYKELYKHYNKLNALLLISLTGLCSGITQYKYSPKSLPVVMAGVFSFIPLIYFIFLLCMETKQFVLWLKECCFMFRSGYKNIDLATA